MKCDNCKEEIIDDAEYASAEEKGTGIPHIIYNPETGQTVKRLCHKCFCEVCPTHINTTY